MVKRVKKAPFDPKGVYIAIWIAGALGVFFIPASIDNASDLTILAIFTAIVLATAPLLSLLFPLKTKNRLGILIPGSVLTLLTIAMIFDIWHESTTYANACGSGYSAGNCFLIDGLGIMLYIVAIPLAAVVSSALLAFNVSRKARSQ